jgi:hypothetical protein
MTPEPLFHVGIVVLDLEEAVARFTELLGLSWGPLAEVEATLVDGEGEDFGVRLRSRLSSDAPHVELIEEVPGTVWECNEHSNLHHIGFWTETLVEDSARFSGAGCPLVIAGRVDGQVPARIAYHSDPLGVRVELTDVALRAMIRERSGS